MLLYKMEHYVKERIKMPDATENIFAIEIKNLTKNYGSKKVLDNISFNVKKGEVMGFLGPNGAGKSTTMNIICGYLASSSGSVSVYGTDTAEFPMEAKKKIGYLPEIPPLYTDMTVMEYLDFVYDLKKADGNKKAHLRKVMEKVHVYDVKDRLIKNLSKGYKQRVGLSQALIGDPEVLILDEPTVGLDPRQIMEIREVICELGKERTVILSTHILQEVIAVCDSYTIINNGKIVSGGSMKEFTDADAKVYKLRVVANRETAEEIAKSIETVESVIYSGSLERGTVDLTVKGKDNVDIRVDIFNAFSKANVPVIHFGAEVKSLESEFLKTVGTIAEEGGDE